MHQRSQRDYIQDDQKEIHATQIIAFGSPSQDNQSKSHRRVENDKGDGRSDWKELESGYIEKGERERDDQTYCGKGESQIYKLLRLGKKIGERRRLRSSQCAGHIPHKFTGKSRQLSPEAF